MARPKHEHIPVWFIAGTCTLHLVEIPGTQVEISQPPYDVVRHVALPVDNLSQLLSRLLTVFGSDGVVLRHLPCKAHA